MYGPQIGGYHAKAVVADNCTHAPRENECFEMWVWHDGEFPYGEDTYPGRPPIELHGCDPEQFIRFGEDVRAMLDELEGERAAP